MLIKLEKLKIIAEQREDEGESVVSNLLYAIIYYYTIREIINK
jgi:hypothetical protein